jgi:hypothetical protein
MAGQPGNYFTAAFGKQTAKGTPQTTPNFKARATGGFVRPERQILELEETDSSRQASELVVVGSRVGGTMSHYLRSNEYALFAYAAQGAIATTGAGPYTHTLTMTGSAPYMTIYEAYGSTVLVNRYVDCRCVRHVLRGTVGGAFVVENQWAGITAQFGQTDPAGAASSATPLTWPHVTVTKGGVTADVISEIELVIDNGGEYIEGDVGIEPIDYVFGRWVVSGQLVVLFEDDDHFREFHGGSASATVPGTTLFAEDLMVTISRSPSDEVVWDMTEVQYQTYDLQPNTAGTPIRVPMAFRAKPQPLVADTLEIRVKNTVPSY